MNIHILFLLFAVIRGTEVIIILVRNGIQFISNVSVFFKFGIISLFSTKNYTHLMWLPKKVFISFRDPKIVKI